MTTPHEIVSEWVHVEYSETGGFREVYGFAGGQGIVHLEGIRYTPKDRPSRTLVVYMHPASTLQLLPIPRAMAESGMHVLCAASRYARNDTPLIMEKVVLDLGAYIRHAKEVWKYETIVLAGWSGGGSLALFYQAQSERPTITETPAGDPVDIPGAGLLPADAVLFHAAHSSRARILCEWIDPSVRNEDDPDNRDDRDMELDLYHPRNPNKPPYEAAFIEHFRAAQLDRIRKRTAWVKESLERLRKKGGNEKERGFVTHRTMADPRFLDARLEPNDREIGTSYLGIPETVNNGPVGLARFSTLRAWLSQWSVDDSNADGERSAAAISVPLLVIENTADDAIPSAHLGRIYRAAGSVDKSYESIQGATHYYVGQPELLSRAVNMSLEWIRNRNLWD
jgi:pimeloyl-ACP methyl ester carboxylesterase